MRRSVGRKTLWIISLLLALRGVVAEWIVFTGQLTPPCSFIKSVTLLVNDHPVRWVPVTDKGQFTTAIDICPFDYHVIVQATGCDLIYRKTQTWNSSFSPLNHRETIHMVVGAVQTTAASPRNSGWFKSPIFWLILVGILFLLFVPYLAQLLDDDLYEVGGFGIIA